MTIASDLCHKDWITKEEFTSNSEDRPLILQLASNDSVEFAIAAERMSPFIDGVDLNCGCPQKWVISDGIGAALSSKPGKLLVGLLVCLIVRVYTLSFMAEWGKRSLCVVHHFIVCVNKIVSNYCFLA
jgi:hypothetical protein